MELNSLVNKVADAIEEKELKLKKADIKFIIRTVFDEVKDCLESNDSISIPKFGKFKAVLRRPKKARNPKTQEVVKVPAHVAPVFKAYDSLKNTVRSNAPLHFKKKGK